MSSTTSGEGSVPAHLRRDQEPEHPTKGYSVTRSESGPRSRPGQDTPLRTDPRQRPSLRGALIRVIVTVTSVILVLLACSPGGPATPQVGAQNPVMTPNVPPGLTGRLL